MMRGQKGFTLIEVVVAFAIFALSVGALYGLFSSATKRTAQADAREAALLVAQSMLSQLRAQPGLVPTEQTGTMPNGLAWQIQVAPFKANIADKSPWRAVEVTVSVRDPQHAAYEYSLKSIELSYAKLGTQQ